MITMVWVLGALTSSILWLSIRLYGLRIRRNNKPRREALFRRLGHGTGQDKVAVGFFHPYCNAGGGGERVLWTAIAHIQRTRPNVVSVVYSGDIDATKEQIIAKVKSRFNIELDPTHVDFVFLTSRYLVEDSAWPRFTLLGQSLGSMYLAWEAMTKFIPDLFLDTMGYAFTFHVVSLLGNIPIGAYVHYPTISTDMLKRVQKRTPWHTNTNAISSSATLSQAKLLYYRLFMYYYSISLRTASFLMVNSTWTKEHVDAILQYSNPVLDLVHCLPPLIFLKLFTLVNAPRSATIVYPPCDTKEISLFSLEHRERVILSLAQFRPEKDHVAQLHAFHELLKAHPELKNGPRRVRLILIGGSRNDGDAARVAQLRRLASELDLEMGYGLTGTPASFPFQSHVEFIVNAPYATVLSWLGKASIGLSTMVDEHFGINIVEYMAAGVIPVTHASGGPLKDIVVPLDGKPTGHHATTPAEFAEAFFEILSLSPEEEVAMRKRARSWAVQTFSEAEFEKGWDSCGWEKYVT